MAKRLLEFEGEVFNPYKVQRITRKPVFERGDWFFYIIINPKENEKEEPEMSLSFRYNTSEMCDKRFEKLIDQLEISEFVTVDRV